jgi:CRISPR/Cas system-associated protein endoribonuclease Cas2
VSESSGLAVTVAAANVKKDSKDFMRKMMNEDGDGVCALQYCVYSKTIKNTVATTKLARKGEHSRTLDIQAYLHS